MLVIVPQKRYTIGTGAFTKKKLAEASNRQIAGNSIPASINRPASGLLYILEWLRRDIPLWLLVILGFCLQPSLVAL